MTLHTTPSLSLGLIMFIVLLIISLFVLGTCLIINGQRNHSLVKVIIGIFLTGLFWGVAIYFINSDMTKSKQCKDKHLDDLIN